MWLLSGHGAAVRLFVPASTMVGCKVDSSLVCLRWRLYHRPNDTCDTVSKSELSRVTHRNNFESWIARRLLRSFNHNVNASPVNITPQNIGCD
ncbi:hypothetical protein BC835DRAFT_1332816 [Cytidiella melzeri]|nr:hypothetical protein BC835DRAFT_1332816 [Cytidiella melzeri]